MRGKDFDKDDFLDLSKPIIIRLVLKITDDEIGIFGDNFSTNDKNEIELKFQQNSPIERITIVDDENSSEILTSQIKKSNFIGYTSNIRPIKDNDLTMNFGNYKLIPQLVKKYIEQHNTDNEPKNDFDVRLVDFINSNLNKLQSFNQRNISVGFEVNYADLITRSLSLTDNKGIEFSRLGYGVQFSSLIPLKIIDTIINWSKYNQLDEHLLINTSGKKYLQIVLCLDEPEIHLHPNLQLKLMKYLRNLLSGKDDSFNSLLKELFQIDFIKGQLFSVTHSPNILSTNYHQIERFYTDNGKVKVVSGRDLSFDQSLNKQLKRQFPYVTNALFADAVIIVEGDSELSAFPIFSDTLGKSIIDYNINIVKSDGFQSIKPLNRLFNALHIKTILVADNDNKHREWPDNTFVTDKEDFEYECFSVMTLIEINQYLNDFETIIQGNTTYTGSFWFEFLTGDKDRILQSKNKVTEISNILKSKNTNEKKNIKSQIEKKIIKNYLKKKSIINGQLIANNIKNVPDIYRNAIEGVIDEK